MKHQYLSYLTEAKRLSEKSADIAMAAIADFERSTQHKSFKTFHIEKAKRYKRLLKEAVNPKTKKPLSKATINSRLNAVKAFFFWLSDKPGYKSRISYSDCEYFNLSANDSRIASASQPVKSPDIEQIRFVIDSMPFGTDIEKRNRALIAFTIATGMRIDAIKTIKVKHVNLKTSSVYQDANEVNTKFRKSMITTFMPVGDDIVKIIHDWINHLKTSLHFGSDDPVFPKTRIEQSSECAFEATGLSHDHWQGTGSIRDIFRLAFENAGLPYFHPHSFKHSLARLGEQLCNTPEDFKAWSQNLAHENVMTTFTSYGKVSDHRQAEIILGLASNTHQNDRQKGSPSPEEITRVLEHLQKENK